MLKLNKLNLLVLALLVIHGQALNYMNVQIVDPNDKSSNILEKDVQVDEKLAENDLCANVECEAGERCIVTGDEAICECYEDCMIPTDERQKICSSANQTFESDCHFLRQKCWCNKNERQCIDLSIVNDKLDYYGACRYIEHCSDKERQIFIERMKIWLDEVLHILDERKDLDQKYFSLVKSADEMKAKKFEKYWTAGVIFEFCQLDKSKDHSIQKEEIATLVSSIKSLEHCIQPFLDECDQNQDGIINEEEWGKSLGLSSDDMALLKQYC